MKTSNIHSSAAPSPWPIRIFYDASCRLCAAEMNNLRIRDTLHRLRFIDCSAADFQGGPAPTQVLMQRLHCQDANGQVFEGVDAFRLLYRTLGMHGIEHMLANPVLGGASRWLYPIVARHRQKLPAWLIAPLFERAAHRAAQKAARNSLACQNGSCEISGHPQASNAMLGSQTAALGSDARGEANRPAHSQPAAASGPKGAVLLTGANGFIGRHLTRVLTAHGYTVLSVSRSSTPKGDFVHMTQAGDWLPWLQDEQGQLRVLAVINAVGALRDVPGRPLQALHADAPKALFDACAQVGLRRVVQISALGIDNSTTRYASTKRAADEHLLALTTAGQLDGLVIRPSMVFGSGGASSELFMLLARLPVLAMPKPALKQPIQPVAVHELAQAIVNLCFATPCPTGLQEFGGPQALSMADFIASLRTQARHGRALRLPLPNWATRLSAKAGNWVHSSPWCSESLALMNAPNITAPDAFAKALGRAPTPPDSMLALRDDRGPT